MTGWIMSEHGVPDSRLTIIEQVEDYVEPKSQIHQAQWLCKCSCDEHNQIVATGKAIKSGNTKSCGCLKKESTSLRFKKYNKYDLSGDYGVGWTFNTNKEFYFDLEDYEKIKNYCWYENKDYRNNYRRLVSRDPKTNEMVSMHQLIFEKNCDHKNRNTLDNRKNNLRPATNTENVQNQSRGRNNTSGFIGVSFHKTTNQWMAYIKPPNKKTKNLGYFNNKKDAIITRLKAEIKYFGNFAPQRHLFKEYGIVYQEERDE